MSKTRNAMLPIRWHGGNFALIESLEVRTHFSFTNWSSIGPAIALVPTSAGAISSTSVVNFGSTIYTGSLNVANTLNRIRANGTPDRSDDGIVYTNPQASGLPVDGTYYEFTVEPTGGTDHNFGSSIAFPGPMRVLLATGGDVFFTGDHYSTFQLVYMPGAASTPTIGGFTVSPSSVVTGATVTFTAANVTETSGTISTVNFYRDTNSTTGYQSGGDTLVGAGTKSGTTWTLSTVVSLAAGNYTYYAVATDTATVSSAASSAPLTITSTATGNDLLAWDVNGQTAYGTQGLGATAIGTGIIASLGLTRGSGVTTAPTASANTWGGNGWSQTTSAAGITGNEFVTFGLTVAPGYTASITSLDMNWKGSGSGPTHQLWQYQLNSGSWISIPSGDITLATGALPALDTSSITALQSLVAGSIANFRIVPYGATATGGNWYISDLTGNDLVVNGSAAIAKTALVLTGPANYIRGDGTSVSVWNNSTATGTATVYTLSNISTLTFAGTSANDSLTVDFSTGLPLVSGGLTFNGSTGTNSLNIIGTSGADAVTVGATTATLSAAFGSATITYSNASAINFTGVSGADVLTQSAQPGGTAQLAFLDSGETDTLNVNAGTFTFPAPASGSGIVDRSLATLSIKSGAKVVVAAPITHADRTVLIAGAVTFAGSSGAWAGQLDLAGNDLILHNQTVATAFNEVVVGAHLPAFNWQGQGIIDSSALTTSPGTALGVTSGIVGTFDGEGVVASDILVKHTLFGDADVNGVVNANDYTQIDNGFNMHGTATGWQNGDFNYDGLVDGSDYSLIDNAFNTQTSTPLTEIAVSTSATMPTMTTIKKATAAAEIAQNTPATDATSQSNPAISEILDLWRKKQIQ